MNKAIIISAPSGAGKTTIVKALLERITDLEFSISACTRALRPGEVNGKDYYFLSTEDFKQRIDRDEFVEFQEVYPGSFYGTLKSEMQRIWDRNRAVIFEVDAVGGLNLKKYFGDQAMAIFIRPPSIEALEQRLQIRNTEDTASIRKRMNKARFELSFAEKFDTIIVNDQLERAIDETVALVSRFLNSSGEKDVR
ncbi:MAG TPA: guanylate kinase [Bacteroidales bacterium]|nr:guanylate kinase [Bacteroidales bacterium]HPS73152.1 guanylate kinase [Bacteroidales bacterium]